MGQNSSCSDSNGQWTSQQGEPAQVNGVEPFAQPTDSASVPILIVSLPIHGLTYIHLHSDLQGSSEAKDLSPNTTEIPPTGIECVAISLRVDVD